MSWILDAFKGILASPGLSISVTPPTFAAPNPLRPAIIPHPSPNYHRTPGRKPTCVILHATAGGFQGALRELCDPKPDAPEKRVSAHYLIDRFGMVYGLVNEEDVAWHAGVSFWRGMANVNVFSIGIELENANDGLMLYPEIQIEAAVQLTRAICADHNIAAQDVIGHLDIAPGRKDDPRGLDLVAFRARLA